MSTYEAVKIRLDPTPRQERMLASHAGAARFAYNAGLAHVKDARGGDTSRADTTSGNANPNETRTKQPPTSGIRLGAGLGNETMRF